MRKNENTTQNPAPKKGKTYYPILTSRNDVQVFLHNLDKCKNTFPALMEQVNEKSLHADTNELKKYVEVLLQETGKLGGTVRSTLSYARNHADDGLCQLAHDSETLEALKQAAKDIKDFEKGVEFAISQSRTMSVFHALARGIIPSVSDSTAVDPGEADTPSVDTELDAADLA